MDFPILGSLKNAIRRQFGHAPDEVVRLDGGLSGTPIFRFSLKSQLWVLRGWPNSTESQTKIDNWFKVVSYWEQQASELRPWFENSPIPRPEPWGAPFLGNPFTLQLGEHFWTIAKWVPGEPLKPEQVHYDSVVGFVKQLAVLHRVTRGMQRSRAPSLGLSERRKLLREMRASLDAMAFSCARHPLKDELAQFVIQCNDRFKDWSIAIDRLASQPCETHWILRDLWRDNLLVDSDVRWVHSVDVGASRIDWPTFDFIRLIGSLLEPIRSHGVKKIWHDLSDVYDAIHPKSDLPNARDLNTIHEISTAISIGYWYKKTNERNGAPIQAGVEISRMQELLRIFLISLV